MGQSELFGGAVPSKCFNYIALASILQWPLNLTVVKYTRVLIKADWYMFKKTKKTVQITRQQGTDEPAVLGPSLSGGLRCTFLASLLKQARVVEEDYRIHATGIGRKLEMATWRVPSLYFVPPCYIIWRSWRQEPLCEWLSLWKTAATLRYSRNIKSRMPPPWNFLNMWLQVSFWTPFWMKPPCFQRNFWSEIPWKSTFL